MPTRAAICHQLQASLFPGLEQTLGRPLTERQRRLVAVLEVVRSEEHVRRGWAPRQGRPPKRP